MYVGSLFIEMAMGWGKYSSITLLLTITCIISISGGLSAIMYIDALQAVIMIFGSFILCGMGFIKANIRSVSQFQSAYLNTTLDLANLKGKLDRLNIFG